MMVRQLILLFLIVLPGIALVVFFTYFALTDWAALQADYANFARVAAGSGSMRALTVAEAFQNIHRINLFADGVWVLLSAIFAAIGVHGMCVNQAARSNR
ncbi:MAG: hypothetical protein ACYDBB_11360 [Armatimonadota bacterium]